MQTYIDRRSALLEQMQSQGGGVAILSTNQEMKRNSDCFFPFRHDSYFYYLTGFTEPEAVVVLVAGKTNQSILFCREKNPEREIWDGFCFGPEAAQQHFGFDAAFANQSLEAQLPDLLADTATIFHTQGYHVHLDAIIQAAVNTVRSRAKSGILAPKKNIDLHNLLDEMRLFKDASEITLMQKAASISSVVIRS